MKEFNIFGEKYIVLNRADYNRLMDNLRECSKHSDKLYNEVWINNNGELSRDLMHGILETKNILEIVVRALE
jgi:hypothetical protein